MKPLPFCLRILSVLALAVIAATGASAQVATPSFTAVFSPDPIGPGGTSTLTFTIDNTGNASPVENLAFDEILPAGLTIVGSGASSTCTAATLTATNGTNVISFADAGVAGSSSCTVSMDVTATATGAITTGDLTSDAGNSGTASATLTVDATRPGFTKAFNSSTVNFGETFTMTYTIDNTGNAISALNPAFSETLPTGFTVASPAQASTTCGNTFTAAAGSSSISMSGASNVAAGASCTASVNIVAGIAGVFTLEAGELTSTLGASPFTFGSSGSAAAQITVTSSADLSISKQFSDDPIVAGETVTLEYTIRNNDRDNAVTGLAFTDDMDATLSGLVATGLPLSTCGGTLSGTNLLSFTGGSLAAGASCVFEATLQIPGAAADGSYPSTSTTLTSDQGNGNTASDSLVVAAFEELVFSKSFTDDPTLPGDTVTLDYTITNPNAGLAVTAIGFSDILTDAISGATATMPAAGSCGVGSVFFNVAIPPEVEMQMSGGDLAAGADCTISMTLNVPGAAAPGDYPSTSGDLSYTVAATATTTSGASDTLTVAGGADLMLTKAFSDDQAVSGGTTDLTFTISSAAESANTATALAFTDNLAAFLTGTTLNSELTNTCNGTLTGPSTLSYSGGSIDPGDSCEISVRLNLGAGTGTQTNTTSTLTATAGGEATTAAAASDDIFLNASEPPVLSFSFNPDTVFPGATIQLDVTLENPAANATNATGIAFSSSLTGALSGLASSSGTLTNICGTGSQITGTTLLSFTGGDLAPGDSCNFSLNVEVPAGAADGSYSLVSSSVTATVGVPVIGTVATTTLTVASDVLQASKSFIDDPVLAGDTATLRFTIENIDPDDAIDTIGFTDDLDAMLSGTVVTGLPAPATVCGGGTLSGTSTLSLAGGALAAGGSCTFDVTVQVPGGASAGSYTNTTGTFTGDVGGLAVTGAAVSDTLQVTTTTPPSFDLSILGDPAPAEGELTYRFTITNNDSSATLSDLEFTNDLDAVLSGLVATGGTGSNICGSGSSLSGSSFLAFSGGTIDPSASCSFDVSVQVPASPTDGSYTNTTSDLLSNGLTMASAASDTFTVDATDPTLSAIDLIAGSDTGSSDSDDETADSSPTVEFTAESGATIEIDWGNGSGFVSASAGTGAAQQETIGTAYGRDGDKTIEVRATDATGNQASQSLTIHIDTTDPDAPSAPDLLAASDSGSSDSDDITADSTPDLSGTAEADATVTVSSSLDGVLGTATADGSGNWSFTVGSALSAGDHNITATATDLAGNSSSGSSALALRIDLTAPTITAGAISLSGASGTGGAFKIGDTVTAAWDNSGSGDGNSDVDSATFDFSTFGGGSAVVASNSGDTWTASYTIVAGVIDATSLNVSVTATDLAGNSDTTTGTDNATADSVAPTLTSGNISVSGGSGAGGVFIIGDTISVIWDNSGSGDNNSDTIAGVTVDFTPFGGGSAVAASESAGIWTATFAVVSGTGDSGDDIEVTATDDAGNTTLATDTSDPDLDTTAPDVMLTSDTASVISGQTATITFDFSENVVNFEDSDVTTTGGSLSSVTMDGSDTTIYTAVFTPDSDTTGAASITVADASYSDAAGNLGSAGASPSLSIDTLAPGVTLTSDVDRLAAGETATITFSFSDTPTGFEDSDITVTGGSLSSVVVDGGDPSLYTAVFTPTADSTETPSITVAAGSYTDAVGNAGTEGTSPDITVDTAVPGVTLSADAAILSGVFQVTATFGEEMTGFRRRDITVGNGRASNLSSSDNTVFTFDVTPASDGEVTIDIAADVAQDDAGNGNAAADQLSITSDSTAPGVEITGPSDAVGGLFQATVTFSEDVTGFQQGDLSIAHGVISNFAGSGDVYTFDVTPEIGETVVIGLAAGVAEDAAGNSNLAAADYSVRGSTPAQEFEEHREEVRDIVKNEAYTQLNAQVLANTRMVRQARNRFILGKSQLDDPGGGLASRNNLDFDIDGSLEFVDRAFNTRGVFSQQRGNFEGSYRRILFGDFDVSRDENGTVSAYLSGKVAWEQMINDRTMLGYNIGLDLGRSDIEGSFSGSQDSIGVSIGGYFVSQLAERIYADGFISFGVGRNNLELDNGTLALSSDYDSYTTTIGAALTGVYEMSGYELWPELSFTYGYTDIGVIGLTGTAFGVSDSSLTLDAGYVALGTLSFAPEFIIPMDGRPALESNRMLSFKPNVTCEMVKSGSSTSNCGGGVALGIYAVSQDGQALLDAKVRIDRIGDVTRTGLELSFDYAF